MRICIVYDCLFPHTVGGAERWYRGLAERLVADGHEVTYLTLRQWERGVDPRVAGVKVIAVGPRMRLYSGPGRRRILPPVVFGAGVLWHLIRHGGRYDAVHTCSFPYFSLLAAGLARMRWSYRLVVDWFEVWSRSYWREYLGRIGGDVGWLIQRACARIPQHAFCFSRLYAARLREEGLKGEITALAGAYDGPGEVQLTERTDSLVLFAGRHIPEKRVPAIPPALVKAREQVPQLRAAILGDGPDRSEVMRLVNELGLGEMVQVPGFVDTETVHELMAGAMCILLPSQREGYGLVVIEGAAYGTPSVVVSAPDNAATELVVDGENGFIAPSASPEDLATAIVRISEAGSALRRSTADWFAANARRLGIDGSLETVARSYRG